MTRCCNMLQDVRVARDRVGTTAGDVRILFVIRGRGVTVDIGNLTFGLAHAVRMMMCTPLSESTTPDISPT